MTTFELIRGQQMIYVEISGNLLLEGSSRYVIMSISEANMPAYLASGEFFS